MAERNTARANAISLGGMRDVHPQDEDYACALIDGVDYIFFGR